MNSEINKLLSIKAIRSFMVVMPIIAIYFQEAGLSIQDIFLLQVIFSVAIVLFEIPSGYFADIFGRKKLIVLGSIFAAVGYLAYWMAGGFLGFAVAEILLALSISFLSGADSAFLYDTLLEHNSAGQHVRFQGRIISATRISEAVAALAGGFLATIIALKSIFFVGFLIMASAIPIAFSLREPRVPFSTEKKRTVFEIISFALHENKTLLYLNIFSGVISTSTLVMVWFVQPYWEQLGVPIFLFGIMWAALNIIVAIGAFFAHRVEKFFSFRVLFGITALVPVVLYGLLSLGLTYLSLAVIPLFWLLRGVFQPISLDYINRQTDSETRATVVSISQLFGRLIFSITSPFLGWVADVWTLEIAFLTSAVVFGLLAISFGILLVLNIEKNIRAA